MSRSVTTETRLDRSVRAFKLMPSVVRRFAGNAAKGPSIATIACGAWRESSTGDALHKLVLVVKGQVDIEGPSGGWLVVPNHMIFVPANRPFNLRTAPGTVVHAAFLDPNDHPWHHSGCWVTPADRLVHEMLAMMLAINSREPKDSVMLRQLLKTLSFLCQEWFSNPKMLWLPAAKSAVMRTFVRYVRDHLSDVTVQAACEACGVPQRTMQRLSQQEFSFGLKTLITEVRMMRAMELLVGHKLPVEAIARSVGYASLSAFTTAFTARFGLSPGDYRTRNRNALDSSSGLWATT